MKKIRFLVIAAEPKSMIFLLRAPACKISGKAPFYCQMKKRSGLTLLEIIISIIILSVTMIGLASIFISGKRYILHARARMGGGELGKFFLDPLQADVREDTWGDPNNNLTVQPYLPRQELVNNITYNYTHTVVNAPGDADLRKVVAEIGWNEIHP